MIFIYLLFGHLIADFLLQPANLIKLKFKKWYGIFIHVLIHFVVLSIVLFPFLIELNYNWLLFLFSIMIIVVTHFVIDYFKIIYEKTHKNYTLSFWIDQLSHWIILAAVSTLIPIFHVQSSSSNDFLKSFIEQSYLNVYVIAYLVGSIFVTYTIEMGKLQKSREATESFILHINKLSMLKRLAIFSVLYFFFLFAVLK